jgi:hypothetical protein
MPTKARTQSYSRNLLLGIILLGVASVILCVVVGFQVSTGTARPKIEHRQQTLNRALKGDRMVPAFSSHTLRRDPGILRVPSFDSRLADGCEALVSPLANTLWARTAGRCLS